MRPSEKFAFSLLGAVVASLLGVFSMWYYSWSYFGALVCGINGLVLCFLASLVLDIFPIYQIKQTTIVTPKPPEIAQPSLDDVAKDILYKHFTKKPDGT